MLVEVGHRPCVSLLCPRSSSKHYTGYASAARFLLQPMLCSGACDNTVRRTVSRLKLCEAKMMEKEELTVDHVVCFQRRRSRGWNCLPLDPLRLYLAFTYGSKWSSHSTCPSDAGSLNNGQPSMPMCEVNRSIDCES